MAHPTTIGEWDIEIEALATPHLERYRAALEALHEWEAFNGAFKWTRMFVLGQSVGFELEKRARAKQ